MHLWWKVYCEPKVGLILEFIFIHIQIVSNHIFYIVRPRTIKPSQLMHLKRNVCLDQNVGHFLNFMALHTQIMFRIIFFTMWGLGPFNLITWCILGGRCISNQIFVTVTSFYAYTNCVQSYLSHCEAYNNSTWSVNVSWGVGWGRCVIGKKIGSLWPHFMAMYIQVVSGSCLEHCEA